MYNDTGAVDAASILLNLDDHTVLSSERHGATRSALVEPISREAACPSCGVFSRLSDFGRGDRVFSTA